MQFFQLNNEQKTKLATVGVAILDEPLWQCLSFLVFFLYAELGAGASQIVVYTMLKPIVAIFSMYLAAKLVSPRNRLLDNLLITRVICRIPFLFFPWITNSWVIIIAAACYMMAYRASVPAWMEILRLNLNDEKRSKVVSFSHGASYIEGTLIAMAIGSLLAYNHMFWKYLFPLGALLGIVATVLQYRVPMDMRKLVDCKTRYEVIRGWKTPWKEVFRLVVERKDFFCYQEGYMISGFGIMLVQPVIPMFYHDALHLSYMDLAIALAVCKGLSLGLTSPYWGKLMTQIPFFQFHALIFALFAFFPCLIIFAKFHIGFVFLAYVIYGLAQAGSQLSWHLSGTFFAKKEDSSLFSTVNLLAVGIRGCIAPPLGGIIASFLGAYTVMILGAAFCAWGAYKMYTTSEIYSPFYAKKFSGT